MKIPPKAAPVVTPTKADSVPAAPNAGTAVPAGKGAWSPGDAAARPRAAAGSAPAQATAAIGVPANPKDMDIICPVLGAMVAEGKVKMSPDGTIKISDLRKGFDNQVGMTTPAAVAAAALGFFANKPSDILHNTLHREFNVLDLRAGFGRHQGDSDVLAKGKFDGEKFKALVSHAKNGVMTEDSFAAALAANTSRDDNGTDAAALKKGKTLASGEYGALLAVFGKKDPATGQLGIAVEDLRAMFQDKKLPPVPEGNLRDIASLTASVGKAADVQLATGAFRSTSTVTGLAQAGVNLSNGVGAKASAQASVGAGKAASCPHMNGVGKMPTPNEIPSKHALPSD